MRVRLIVTDTGPLITLAAAEALDYLLYPTGPVIIPDAVLYEATVKAGAIGASEILRWTQANSERVRSVATEAFLNFSRLREIDETARERDLGERAALETIRYAVHLEQHERVLLLTEDETVIRGSFLVSAEDRDRVVVVTTADFLAGLEAAGRINSADEIYRRVVDAGRAATRRAVLDRQHEEAKAAVERFLARDAPYVAREKPATD